MPPIDPHLNGDARVVAALWRTRAVGLHFLGHYLSVCAVEGGAEEAALLRVVPPHSPRGRAGTCVSMELAVLADIASAAAIRTEFGPHVRISTTHLSVEHLRAPAAGALEARTRVIWLSDASAEGTAICDVVDSRGDLIATALAGFVVLPHPPGRPLRPVRWNALPDEGAHITIQAGDLSDANLDDAERRTLEAVRAARQLAETYGVPITTALVMPSALPMQGDRVSYELPDLSALANRAGHMQGGALYHAAATAAAFACGDEWPVSSGAVQYVRPVHTSRAVVNVRLIRRGSRITFSEVDVLTADQRLAVCGRFTHRRHLVR